MYCQITESYNIVQRYAIWEISHQKIKPTQQMENGRRWRDGLGREAPQATAANHPFPASDPHPSLSPIHWVCQVRLSNQFSSQVSGKTFSQLVWLSYAIQMLLQLTFLNQCNLTTRGLMSLNLRIWFNLGWPTIREPFKYYFADFFRKVGGGGRGQPKSPSKLVEDFMCSVLCLLCPQVFFRQKGDTSPPSKNKKNRKIKFEGKIGCWCLRKTKVASKFGYFMNNFEIQIS